MIKAGSSGLKVSFSSEKSSSQVNRKVWMMGAMTTSKVAIQRTPEDLAERTKPQTLRPWSLCWEGRGRLGIRMALLKQENGYLPKPSPSCLGKSSSLQKLILFRCKDLRNSLNVISLVESRDGHFPWLICRTRKEPTPYPGEQWAKAMSGVDRGPWGCEPLSVGIEGPLLPVSQ